MKSKRILKIALALLALTSILASCTPASTTPSTTTSGLLTTTTTKTTTTTTSVAITSTTTASTPQKPTTQIDPAIGAVLIFEDHFDGTEIDNTKWKKSREQYRHGTLCRWDHDMAFLDGEGSLVLRAEWDEANGYVISGAIDTSGKFTYGYGYYEASICFPYAPGTWGAFWMMCGAVQWGDGVEIDIIESINNHTGDSQSALHTYPTPSELQSLTTSKGRYYAFNIYDGNYHTFGLERTADHYTFYIDGYRVWRVRSTEFPICPDKGYMWLSIEAADWCGAGTAESIEALPAEMYVDYVRVYDQRPW